METLEQQELSALFQQMSDQTHNLNTQRILLPRLSELMKSLSNKMSLDQYANEHVHIYPAHIAQIGVFVLFLYNFMLYGLL